MEEQVSFKTRVKETAIECAPMYNSRFASYDYLVMSDAFSRCPYYIIKAEKDNYLHLVGVHTHLSAAAFFDKCLDGSLAEGDFEISTHSQNEKSAKGSVRRKIKVLPSIGGIADGNGTYEEDFRKNAVLCTFATSNGSCTLGFIAELNARPKTLLSGNELDESKAKPAKIILSRKRGNDKFDKVVAGDDDDLIECFETIKPMISAELASKIEGLIDAEDADKQDKQ